MIPVCALQTCPTRKRAALDTGLGRTGSQCMRTCRYCPPPEAQLQGYTLARCRPALVINPSHLYGLLLCACLPQAPFGWQHSAAHALIVHGGLGSCQTSLRWLYQGHTGHEPEHATCMPAGAALQLGGGLERGAPEALLLQPGEPQVHLGQAARSCMAARAGAQGGAVMPNQTAAACTCRPAGRILQWLVYGRQPLLQHNQAAGALDMTPAGFLEESPSGGLQEAR